ncbi:MAG: hypothetical protein MZV70_51430 [Desulfobacterales bacterium]|nr:hypothetical protein [Desulfobacterales bacterium]
MGKEKVEESVAELIKKGEITEKEGRALVSELVAKSKETTKELEGRIHKVMSDAQDRLHAPAEKRDRRAQEEDRETRERGRCRESEKPEKTAKTAQEARKVNRSIFLPNETHQKAPPSGGAFYFLCVCRCYFL